jgi:hypothetical protein
MQELQLTQWTLNTLLKKIFKQYFTRDFNWCIPGSRLGHSAPQVALVKQLFEAS